MNFNRVVVMMMMSKVCDAVKHARQDDKPAIFRPFSSRVLFAAFLLKLVLQQGFVALRFADTTFPRDDTTLVEEDRTSRLPTNDVDASSIAVASFLCFRGTNTFAL